MKLTGVVLGVAFVLASVAAAAEEPCMKHLKAAAQAGATPAEKLAHEDGHDSFDVRDGGAFVCTVHV